MRTTLVPCILLGLSACNGPAPTDGAHGTEWEQRPLQHARSFTIEARGDQRRLTVFGFGGRADTTSVYVLSTDGMQDLRIPMQRLAVVSTTHLSYIQALGRLGTVVGAAHLDRIVDRELRTALSHAAVDIGTADGLDRERLIALAPDALLDYPFGRSDVGALYHGIPRIAVTEYLEEHPLGRAEWLRFFGVLLGCEPLADSLFNRIQERYAAEVVADPQSRPRVFFGSVWQGQWFVPPNGSYMATLVQDAGAALVFGDRRGGGNAAVDLETVLNACADADHFGAILAVDGTPDAQALVGGDRRLATLKAVQQGGFHGNSATSDLFGKALLEPHLVLRDLACIFHPARCKAHVPLYFAPIE